jgi:hypothetical protein
VHDKLEDLGVVELIFKKRNGGMDWIDLAWDRDLWWDFYECGNERLDSVY